MIPARALQGATLVLVVAVVAAGVGPAVNAGTDQPAVAPHGEPSDPDGDVTMLRGDGALFGTIDDSADLRHERAEGNVGPTTRVVPGNLLVLQFRSERATEIFAGVAGANTTDRFFGMLNESGVDFRVEGRSHGTSFAASELGLDRSNVAVVHDRSNATFSVLVDTGNVSLRERHGGDPIDRDLIHVAFQAVVEIPTDDGERVLVGSSKFVRAEATIRSQDAGAHFVVTPATVRRNGTDDLTVNVSTTLLPGSNLTIRAVAPDGTVLAERRGRTRQPGNETDRFGTSVFRTTLDLGELDADGRFDVVIVSDRPIETRRVVVGDPPRMENTTAELVTDGEHEGQIAVTTTLELPDDGFLLVYVDGDPVTKPVEGGSRVRTTMYVNRSAADFDLSTGTQPEVYVLATWDADGDGVYDRSDPLYLTPANDDEPGRYTELDVVVPVEGWSEETLTSTPSPSSPSPSSPSSPSASPMPSSQSSPSSPVPTDSPGFGMIAAALAIAAAVLRWQRRR